MSKTKETALEKTALQDEFLAHVGEGLENACPTDYQIPEIKKLEGLSKAISSGEEGARVGTFYNTITGETFKTIKVIPCMYKRNFVRWANKTSFRGNFEVHEVEGPNRNPKITKDGLNYAYLDESNPEKPEMQEVKDTRNFYVMYWSEQLQSWMPALMRFTSTNIKMAKLWMTKMSMLRIKGQPAPIFSHVYELSLEKKESDGKTWYLTNSKLLGPVENLSVFKEAAELRENTIKGNITVSEEDEENENVIDVSSENQDDISF